MVSRSSHTSHEFLILVIQVTNVSSAIEHKSTKTKATKDTSVNQSSWKE